MAKALAKWSNSISESFGPTNDIPRAPSELDTTGKLICGNPPSPAIHNN